MHALVLESEPNAADGGADAVVSRDHSRLRVRLEGVDDPDGSVRGLIAADVAAVLRAFDAQISKIDISLA